MTTDSQHLDALVEPAKRQAATMGLAQAMGCEELLWLVSDRETGVFVPAPGMPKTLLGGDRWRTFLQTCSRIGLHQCHVDLPPSRMRPATCVSTGACLVVALGGNLDPTVWELLRQRMPLIGALFVAEHRMLLQETRVVMAQEGAARAHALANALDAARAAAGGLNQKLQDEHRRKDEFLAMLAHELRNPLAPLVNSVAILRRAGQRESSVAPRILDIMQRQISQLSRLVDDLLDVSRVSRGAITLQTERLALGDVLQAALETATPLIEAKKHNATTHGLQHQAFVFGDRTRLIQVFSNLLQNAAKYTPSGGTIAIHLMKKMDRVAVKIADNGVGIPAEMQGPVFELFTQAHAAIDRSEGGLGIGLTLARSLVHLHGGDISVYSAGLNSGSAFTVDLPLAHLDSSHRATTSDAASDSGSTRMVRVLLVEDNPDISETMAELLRDMHAEVQIAEDGDQAIAAAREFSPELILLDIGLPGMSGYEVASRLRAEIDGNFRLVALTGYGSPSDRERARRAGFDDHLVKPAPPETLEQMLLDIARRT